MRPLKAFNLLTHLEIGFATVRIVKSVSIFSATLLRHKLVLLNLICLLLIPSQIYAQDSASNQSKGSEKSQSLFLFVRKADPFGLRGTMIEEEKDFLSDLETLSNVGGVRLTPQNLPFIPRYRTKAQDGYNFHFEFKPGKQWGFLVGLQSFQFDFLGAPMAFPTTTPSTGFSLPIALNASNRMTLYSANLYHTGIKWHYYENPMIDPYFSFRIGYAGYISDVRRSLYKEVSSFEPATHNGTTLGLSFGSGLNLHFSPEIGFNLEFEYWNLRNQSDRYENRNLDLFQWQFGTFLKMQ